MKIVFDLSRRYWKSLAALMALEALGAGLSLLGPMPLRIAVDVAVQKRPLPGWLAPCLAGAGPGLLAALAALSVAVAVLSQAQGLCSRVLSALTGERMTLTLRTQLFAAALRLSLKRHIEKGAADAYYRIESDSQTAESILLDGALPIFTSLVTLLVMLAALFRLSPLLGAVGLAVAPPLLLTSRLIRPALKAGVRGARERESRALSVVQESLGALSAVKAFGREDAEADRFQSLAAEAVRARMRVAWLDGSLGAGVELFCAAGTALALYVEIRMVQQDRLTLGQALLGLTYLGQIYLPLTMLGRKWASLQAHLSGLGRAMVLLEEPTDAPEHPRALSIARARGEIALDGVTFAYDDRRPVLQNASLAIAAGERVGVIGETGAGKTTLLSLLLRLYDPSAGTIRLDGVDLRLLKIADLRRQLAVVFQETVLFQGTIAENIAVGRPGATEAEIGAAARAANLHEAIGRFPDGYATLAGDRGYSLSGGERQRVGLARAFLRDAPILILDEPTSALDAATEALVLEALERLMAGRTVITITHREQALLGCSRVVRVEDGELRAAIRSADSGQTR
jgi:ATP-binding cassette, subfamily B, bacterial